MPNDEKENLKGEDDSPSAADCYENILMLCCTSNSSPSKYLHLHGDRYLSVGDVFREAGAKLEPITIPMARELSKRTIYSASDIYEAFS